MWAIWSARELILASADLRMGTCEREAKERDKIRDDQQDDQQVEKASEKSKRLERASGSETYCSFASKLFTYDTSAFCPSFSSDSKNSSKPSAPAFAANFDLSREISRLSVAIRSCISHPPSCQHSYIHATNGRRKAEECQN